MKWKKNEPKCDYREAIWHGIFCYYFVVENSYINEWEHSVICKYMVLGPEIFAPTSMINTVILFLTGITLKSNEPIVHNNKTTKASFELYYLN